MEGIDVKTMIALAAAAALLAGCAADYQPVKQDWRTIHRPAPTTPGGGDGSENG